MKRPSTLALSVVQRLCLAECLPLQTKISIPPYTYSYSLPPHLCFPRPLNDPLPVAPHFPLTAGLSQNLTLLHVWFKPKHAGLLVAAARCVVQSEAGAMGKRPGELDVSF